MSEDLVWPDEMVPREEMRAWLTAHLPGNPQVTNEIVPLRVKRWGATGRFDAGGTPVIGKHAAPPLYPAGVDVHRFVASVVPHAMAPLLAVEDTESWQRSAYGMITGRTADVLGTGCRPAVAHALAAVQVACAERISDAAGLPSYYLPDVIDDLVADVAEAGDQEPVLADRLFAAHGRLREYADELVVTVPTSIDHPDMNPENAIVTADRPVVILDWEEAGMGCPLLSLSRLLQDADDQRQAIIEAYRDGIRPWRRLGDLERMIEYANILAPIKAAAESRAYARALRWPPPYHNHPNYTARMLQTALDRFDELAGQRYICGPSSD